MKPTSSKMRDVPPLSTKQNMLWNSAGSMTYLACQWLVTVLVVRLSAGYDDAGLLSHGVFERCVPACLRCFVRLFVGEHEAPDERRRQNGERCQGGAHRAALGRRALRFTQGQKHPKELRAIERTQAEQVRDGERGEKAGDQAYGHPDDERRLFRLAESERGQALEHVFPASAIKAEGESANSCRVAEKVSPRLASPFEGARIRMNR